MDPASLTLFGKWFHKLGPPTAKERSPNKNVLEVLGMTRQRCDDGVIRNVPHDPTTVNDTSITEAHLKHY